MKYIYPLRGVPFGKRMILNHLCYHSKNIYNSGLYCNRQWFRIWTTYVDYISDNIEHFISLTTPDDRLVLAKNIYFKNDFAASEKLKLIIENSYTLEEGYPSVKMKN